MTEKGDLPQFQEVVLGPDDFLVLILRQPITPAKVAELNGRLPAALRGRVVMVDGLHVTVARGGVVAPSREPDSGASS